MVCRLCRDPSAEPFFSDPPRTYFHCTDCGLIFTSEDSYLTPSQEKDRYEMHDNTVSNGGYVGFLQKVAEVVINSTPPEGLVLDFGCGKNAVLETILKKQSSLTCESYDPLFDRGIDFTGKKYDTIVLCEVIEHLRNLPEELELIRTLLTSDGKVIIRTQKYTSRESFATWWYRQDSTHINFFNDSSLLCAGSLLKRKKKQTIGKDIVILLPQSE